MDSKPGMIGSAICTYSGLPFDPFNPDANNVRVADIAHALSCMPRFSGHTTSFYSVAQHSVLASRHCDKADAGYGLFHDAAEAYLHDIPPQIKAKLDGYKDAENACTAAIYKHVGLDPTKLKPASVKTVDLLLVNAERKALMPEAPWWGWSVSFSSVYIRPWPPEEAERRFIDRYIELRLAGWFK